VKSDSARISGWKVYSRREGDGQGLFKRNNKARNLLDHYGEKGKGTEAYDGQSEPDDAETVLLPHGDQQVNDAG